MQHNIEKLVQHQNIILFDAVCVLCNGWVKFLLKYDRQAYFKLASVQSPLGQEILKYYQMPTDQFDTMLTIDQGKPYTQSTAFLKVMQQLGFPFSITSLGLFVPRFIRDFLYNRIALNRYNLFGKTQTCVLPSAENKQHFLEDGFHEH